MPLVPITQLRLNNMHIKPKDIKVDLPAVFSFDDFNEIPALAAAINTIIHGKVKVKCEELGLLGGKYMGIFYIQRNDEYQDLRNEFVSMINHEIMDVEGACGTDGKDYQEEHFKNEM